MAGAVFREFDMFFFRLAVICRLLQYGYSHAALHCHVRRITRISLTLVSIIDHMLIFPLTPWRRVKQIVLYAQLYR